MSTSSRRVFNHAVTGLFVKAFGAKVTPPLKAKFKELGLDLDRIPMALEASVFSACFDELRAALFPGRSADEAGREMGRAFLDAYFDTTMGALQRTMLKLVPTDRVVERAPEVAASGTNFIKPTVERVEAKHYRVKLNDHSTDPSFLAGLIERGIVLSRSKSPEVHITRLEGRQVLYEIRWQ